MSKITKRLFCAFAGLYGGSGIAAYAAASHIGGYYDAIAPLLLGNGAALIGLSVASKTNIVMRLSGVLIIIGVGLFVSDIMSRELFEGRLFPYAAPLGGTINIIGWLLLVISAFLPLEPESA